MKMWKKIVAVMLMVGMAWANTQGPNSAATITGTGWTNPSNAATTNSTYATISIPLQTAAARLVFSGYGFSLPTTATVLGIQVDTVGHCSAITSCDMAATFGVGTNITKVVGTSAGTAHSQGTSWAGTDSTFTMGSGSDLWGLTWTASEINASGFGVMVEVENSNASLARTASVDSVLITVTFTAGCTSCMLLTQTREVRHATP